MNCTGCGRFTGRDAWVERCLSCTNEWNALAGRCNMVTKALLPRVRETGAKCDHCPRPAFAYDHRDYRKPLKVTLVCRTCNWMLWSATPLRISVIRKLWRAPQRRKFIAANRSKVPA